MKWRDGEKTHRYLRGSYTVATVWGRGSVWRWQLQVDHTIFGTTEDVQSAKRRAEYAFDDWCQELFLMKKEDYHVVATTDKEGRQVLVEGQSYTRRTDSGSYEPDLRFTPPIELGDVERHNEGEGRKGSNLLDRDKGGPRAFRYKPRSRSTSS